jgi:hypothetical protein
MAIRFPTDSDKITVPISATSAGLMWTANAWKTFSLLIWFRPEATPTGAQVNSVVQILDGASAVKCDAGWHGSLGYWGMYIRGASSSAFVGLAGQSQDNIQPGKWHLLAINLSAAGAEFWLRVEGGSGVIGPTGVSSGTYGTLTAPASVRLGATVTTVSPVTLGPVVLRNHAITTADVANVFAAGRILAPFDLTSGNMTGSAGCFFGVGLMQDAVNISIGQTSNPWPLSVLASKIPVYDTGNASFPSALNCPRDITVAGSPVWTSHEWPQYAAPSVFSAPVNNYGPYYLAGGGVKLARLARNQPYGLVRVQVRGQSWSNYEGNTGNGWPGHLPAGLALERLDNVAGFDGMGLWPAVNSGILPYDTASAALLGTDAATGTPATATETSAVDSAGSLGRYNRGSSNAGAGNGHVGAILAGKRLRMLATSLGQMQPHRELMHRLVYFAMPGSPQFRWRLARDSQQSPASINVINGAWSDWIATATATTYTCNYVAQAYAKVGVDNYTLDGLALTSTTASLTLAGVTGSGITAGMCARKGAYDVANVQSATEAGGNTTIVFDHPFGADPVNGDVILFGAWQLASLSVSSPAMTYPYDPATMRGYEIEVEAGGNNLCVMGLGCWAADADGWIFCTDGRGGTSIASQREISNRTGNADGPCEEQWDALLAGDILWLMNASDGTHGANDDATTLPTTIAYYARVRPGAEVLLGVNSYATTQYLTYRTFAASAGLPYVSSMSLYDSGQARSLRFETAATIHFSSIGAQREARESLAQLALATAGVVSDPAAAQLAADKATVASELAGQLPQLVSVTVLDQAATGTAVTEAQKQAAIANAFAAATYKSRGIIVVRGDL